MKYQVTPGHTGYGARIWILQSQLTKVVEDRLKFLSKWGGADKTTDDGEAGPVKVWEFNDNNFGEAIAYLNGYGFTREEAS